MKIAIGVDRFLYFKNGANRYRSMHQVDLDIMFLLTPYVFGMYWVVLKYNFRYRSMHQVDLDIMFLLTPYVFGMYWVVLAWFNTIGLKDNKEYQIVLLQIFYWIIGKFQKKFAKRSTNAVSAIAVIYTTTYQMENWTSPQDPIQIMDNDITFALSNRLGI
uniref:DUF4234 domain-containing protein n=1 Tax=Acrobeloides nanus TaxID=290746 RepID=A0A914CLX4_9BILA